MIKDRAKQPWNRLPGEDVLAEMYIQDGKSIRQIARELGVSRSGIHHALERHKIPRRPEAYNANQDVNMALYRILAQIRQAFLDRDWAEWRDDKHPEQGVELLEEGKQQIEHLVLDDTTISPSPA